VQKKREFAKATVHPAEKLRWFRQRANIANRRTQQFGRHGEFARFAQSRSGRFEKARHAREIDRTNRDQIYECAGEELSKFRSQTATQLRSSIGSRRACGR